MDIFYNQRYFTRIFGKGVLDINRLKEEKSKLIKLKRFLSPNNKLKILDIGCGLGYFLNVCDREGWQTFGADISNYALTQAKKNTIAELIRVDINHEKLLFRNSFFDAVVSSHVVEHLKDDNNYFEEIKRVLKDGGILLISTPAGKSPYDHEVSHINLLSAEKLLNKLTNNGFKILKIEENPGSYKRIIPLRRFPIINWLNKRLCDFIGWYIKEITVIAQK